MANAGYMQHKGERKCRTAYIIMITLAYRSSILNFIGAFWAHRALAW